MLEEKTIDSNKLISVIIPCYNVEKWIDRCLQSIVEQTIGVNKLEIICVDDCSTDETLNKLLAWEQDYADNLIVVQSERNGRQGQARNIGLNIASCDWVAFIDSDDWVDKEYLEWMYRYTQFGEYEIITCDSARDKETSLSYTEHNETELNTKQYIINSPERRKALILNPELNYNAWGKLIRKDFLVNNSLYFLEHLAYEDAAWGSLVHLYVERAIAVRAELYHYFVNESSTILTANSNHHIDCLTVQTSVWDEYEKRGFISEYRDELEIEHLYSNYLAGFKMIVLRFEVPDYNLYLLLRELTLQRIPSCFENHYVLEGIFTEVHLLILKTLDNVLSKAEFMEFAESLKTIGI